MEFEESPGDAALAGGAPEGVRGAEAAVSLIWGVRVSGDNLLGVFFYWSYLKS